MISDILKQKKISIRALANSLNIPYTTLYEYVSGKRDFRKMPLEHFIAISNKLNLGLEELIEKWDDEKVTSVDNNFLIDDNEIVKYRLYKRKSWYIIYVKLMNNWMQYRRRYPKYMPKEFEDDYYNSVANELYYNALKEKKWGDFYENDLDASK